MAPKRQPRRRESTINDISPTSSSGDSAGSSSSGPSSSGAITFQHFTDLQPAPPQQQVKKETKSDSQFKVAFQFVGSQDARKATTENRSHVMREYRRKQRWEQEQKKKMKEEDESKGNEDEREKTNVKIEEPDLGRMLAMSTGNAKRKRDYDDAEYDKSILEDFQSETNTMAMQLLSQVAKPSIVQPSLETPVMDVFTQRFVDTFAPQAQNAGSADAIRSIATVKMFSPLLTNALNAVATTFAGQQVEDKQILDAGHGIYTGVLNSLQQALAHPLYRSEAVLSTVVLCIAYESMRHTTPEALAKHCTGALQLIEFRGPYAHVHGLEHLCFSELRPYWAFAAIVFRTPTFLQEPQWKTVPWSAPGSNKDIMQHLLDHIVDLPSILHQFDIAKSPHLSSTHTPSEISSLHTQLWASTSALHSRMQAWKRTHADTYPSGQPTESPAPLGKAPYPIFKTRNPLTGETLAPPPFSYPDPQLARTLCTYYGALIVLSSVDSRPSNPPSEHGPALQPIQVFGFAVVICRSLEYFIRNVPGNMTNRMMFPFKAAWEATPKGGPEREFLAGIWAVMERRRASKVWSRVTHLGERGEERMGGPEGVKG